MTTTILPTDNRAWGFWGTIGHSTADRSEAWALATNAIGKATSGSPEAVRDFLDSRFGRHFADDVSNGLSASLGLSDAIDATVTQWMGWKIGRRIEREHGIPRGLPYLIGWVAHCAIIADLAD